MKKETPLQILNRWLFETTEEERRALWDKVNKMNIQGPTLEEYIKSLADLQHQEEDNE